MYEVDKGWQVVRQIEDSLKCTKLRKDIMNYQTMLIKSEALVQRIMSQVKLKCIRNC